MSTTDENKALVTRLVEEGLNRRNVDIIDDVYAEGYVHHWGTKYELPLDEYKASVRRVYEGLPDLTATVEHMVAEDDKVMVRYRFRGTHQGELAGVEPSGNEIEWTSTFTYRIDEGRIQEDWEDYDYSAFPSLLEGEEPERAGAPAEAEGEGEGEAEAETEAEAGGGAEAEAEGGEAESEAEAGGGESEAEGGGDEDEGDPLERIDQHVREARQRMEEEIEGPTVDEGGEEEVAESTGGEGGEEQVAEASDDDSSESGESGDDGDDGDDSDDGEKESSES